MVLLYAHDHNMYSVLIVIVPSDNPPILFHWHVTQRGRLVRGLTAVGDIQM